MERPLFLLAAPLVACSSGSYVEAPTAPVTTSATATATEVAAEPEPTATASAAPATVVAAPPPPTPLPAAAISAIAARTASFYAAAAPFVCDLNEETTDPARPAKAQSNRAHRLHLTFERPGKLHVAFSTGAVLVVNGGMLYLTDPSSQQMLQKPVPADYTPLAFAYAGASFPSRAAFIGYPGATLNMPGFDLLVGPPSAPASGVQKVVFFHDASGEVRRTLLIGAHGGRQRLDVVQCTMHVTPSPALFVPPAGQPTAILAAPPLIGVP